MTLAPTATTAPSHTTALVLGATGGIGGTIARQLRARGWTVRALTRRLDAGQSHRDGLTWIVGDAMSRPDVMAAAEGCVVIVHAVNPPGYRDWDRLVLPMLDNTLAAAAAQGATVMLPGTVYNFGPSAWPDLHEDAPQQPPTRKGRLRVQMEQRLQRATQRGEIRSLILRAGDFFGPRAGNNWFSQGLVAPGQALKRVIQPGRPGTGHQWAYLPDVAAAAVWLLERRAELPAFSRFHFEGHWDADGRQMVEAIRAVTQRRTGRAPVIRAFPWWLARLAAPVVPFFREVGEMRYLWEQPIRMDGSRLAALMAQQGGPVATPLEDAVAHTLASLGCLPAPVPLRSEAGVGAGAVSGGDGV